MRFRHNIKFNTHLYILIGLLFYLNSKAYPSEVIKFDVYQNIPYISGLLLVADESYPVKFVIDLGRDTSFSLVNAYNEILKISGNGKSFAFETEYGASFEISDFSVLDCNEESLNLLYPISKDSFLLAGFIGADFFGEKFIYDYSEKSIYINNIIMPVSFDIDLEYIFDEDYNVFKDTLKNGQILTGRINTTIFSSQLNKTYNGVISDECNNVRLTKLGICGFDNNYVSTAVDNISKNYDFEIGNQYMQNYLVYINQLSHHIHFSQKNNIFTNPAQVEYEKLISEKDPLLLLDFIDRYPNSNNIDRVVESIFIYLFEENVNYQELYSRFFETLVMLYGHEQAIYTSIIKCDKYMYTYSSLERVFNILEAARKYSSSIQGESILLFHEIDYRLGLINLHNSRLKQAQKHLLSALFGQPSDSRFNFSLGKLFLRKGLFVRARSRFIKSSYNNDYGDFYLEQLETVKNDPEFRKLFMDSDDRSKNLTVLEHITVDYDTSSYRVASHNLIEVYSCSNRRVMKRLSESVSFIMRSIDFGDFEFINYQLSDFLDYSSSVSDSSPLRLLTEEEPVIIVFNGEMIRFASDDLRDHLKIVNALLTSENKTRLIELDCDIHLHDNEISITIDSSLPADYKAVRYEVLYFNGYSYYDNHLQVSQWIHRNILIASECHAMPQNGVINISSFPDNYHVWTHASDDSIDTSKANDVINYNSIFAGHSFLLVKVYDKNNDILAFSRVNLLDKQKAYYEYH